jgi:hypothetical protein
MESDGLKLLAAVVAASVQLGRYIIGGKVPDHLLLF